MATSGDLIRVEHVIKEYNHGAVKALNDCSLTIQKGEVVAIIGPSGSGKSTLLRCLNLLEVPSSGHIYFNGVDITDKKVDIDLHRRKMGMVFQHFNLFPHMTVQKNITLAPVQLKLKTQEEGAQARPGVSGHRGPARQGQRLPGPALRRPEAAHRHRPRSGYGAGGHAL